MDDINRIWFTADHHFDHRNIIKYCNRPFDSVEQMNRTMIDNWNELIGPDHTVYHLGDVTLRGLDRFTEIMGQLNGHIIIVPGNHDRNWMRQWKKHDRPEIKSFSGHVISVLEGEKGWIIDPKDNVIAISHVRIFPLIFNNLRCTYKDLIHLHGHSHGKNTTNKFVMDVGVDCHNFYPISLNNIKRKLYN